MIVGNAIRFGYYGLVVIVVGMLGYKFYKSEDRNFSKTVEIFLPMFVALAPILLTILPTEKAIEVAFPDVEKYINRADDLEKENKELSENIVNLQKESTKMKNKNKLLGEKKYAEISDTELVVDGLMVKAKNNLVANVDGDHYYHENILKNVTGKEIQYDDDQNKIFIGNQEINKINKIKFEDVKKLLYSGKNEINYEEEENDSFLVAGKEQKHGFVLTNSKYSREGSYGLFNLDGKYSKIEFDIGKVDDSNSSYIEDAKMKIFLDNELSEEHKISAELADTHFEIPVNNAKSLKILLTDSGSNFGFYNIVLTK